MATTTSPWHFIAYKPPGHYYKLMATATSSWHYIAYKPPGHYYKPLTTTTSLQCCYYIFLPLIPQPHSSAPLPPTPLLVLRPHSTAPTAHGYSTTKLTWMLTKPLTGPAVRSGLGVGLVC